MPTSPFPLSRSGLAFEGYIRSEIFQLIRNRPKVSFSLEKGTIPWELFHPGKEGLLGKEVQQETRE